MPAITRVSLTSKVVEERFGIHRHRRHGEGSYTNATLPLGTFQPKLVANLKRILVPNVKVRQLTFPKNMGEPDIEGDIATSIHKKNLVHNFEKSMCKFFKAYIPLWAHWNSEFPASPPICSHACRNQMVGHLSPGEKHSKTSDQSQHVSAQHCTDSFISFCVYLHFIQHQEELLYPNLINKSYESIYLSITVFLKLPHDQLILHCFSLFHVAANKKILEHLGAHS